jgi:2-methylcitrate dehydratase PrpD
MSGKALAEIYAGWAAGLNAADLPAAVTATAGRMLLDISGLCVAARHSDYVEALLSGWDGSGNGTLIGHSRTLDAAGSALVNGSAAHGEDYDDTFEGTPVHAGAVIIPAVLAACERYGGSGADLLKGIAAGAELMCRLALVAPAAILRAGFHPTAVIGTLGATAGVATALRLTPAQFALALGIAGSLASGIIEYLAEGTSTKRLLAGWAAQSGIRAALLARAGFSGPRTVLEGTHGFFYAFTNNDIKPDFTPLTDSLGVTWLLPRIAFKPYACGTMTQPFIDCALQLRRQLVNPDDIDAIATISCRVGEGTVHRLWEPLAEKRRPSTAYSAKFSVPYCIAVALIDAAAGLQQLSADKVRDARVLALSERISYEIDPANEYPRNYSGHLLVTLKDGSSREIDQPHLRGGAREPLTDQELLEKFRANVSFGGWPAEQAQACRDVLTGLFRAADLAGLSALRV